MANGGEEERAGEGEGSEGEAVGNAGAPSAAFGGTSPLGEVETGAALGALSSGAAGEAELVPGEYMGDSMDYGRVSVKGYFRILNGVEEDCEVVGREGDRDDG